MSIINQITTYLPIVSFTIVLLYYGINVRDANRSRQAGLYMQLYSSFRSPEFLKSMSQILYVYNWDGFEDFNSKFSPEADLETSNKITSVLLLFEIIGGLIRQGFLDIKVIEEQVGVAFLPIWVKLGPVLMAEREYRGLPKLWNECEYLFNRLSGVR